MSTTETETARPEVVSLDSLTIADPHQYDYSKLPKYVHPPETKEKLNWAELVTLDLSDFKNEGGKERLAKQLSHAVHHVGFFYVKNYGLSEEEVDNQFTLAKAFFDLPVDEKAKYEVDYANGDYNGWRRNRTENKDRDVEIYNIPKFTEHFHGKYEQPALLQAHLPEIEHFSRALHSNVVLPLLKLFAIILELPDEDYLVNQHSYDKKSEDHFRFMLYHKGFNPPDGGLGGGHTDLGTVTLLFRQPIAGLQILGEDNEWTYVSAQPGTITVNLADTISHLTGGWLKSSVHRVVTPPKDQQAYDRTGLLYFARPHNDTVLNPLDSPVLRRAGVKSRFEEPVTVEQWVKAKQTIQLNPEKRVYKEDGTIDVIGGFKDRKYKQ